MVDETGSGEGDENVQPLKKVELRNRLTFCLIFFTLISCPFLFLIFATELVFIDYYPSSKALWLARMILLVITYAGAAYLVGRLIWTEVMWRKVIAWGGIIILFDTAAILGTIEINNPFHPLACCENFTSYWGWVFPFLKCPTSKFCGFQQAEVLVIYLISNVIFFSSLGIVLITLLNQLSGKIKKKKS